MDELQVWLMISAISNVLLMAYVARLVINGLVHKIELEDLKINYQALQQNSINWQNYAAKLQQTTTITTKLLVDQQTYSLVKLASSPNENEARNAAFKAIQRISSQIGKK
jgi:hypothetical protein